MVYKPGQGPPWDFATAPGPPPIDKVYFRAFQIIFLRDRECWKHYQTALKAHQPVPPYIRDITWHDQLFWSKDLGMSEWFPAWYTSVDTTASPRDFGRLACFNFEALAIPIDAARLAPALGWDSLWDRAGLDLVFPQSLASSPQQGLPAPVFPRGSVSGPATDEPNDEEVSPEFLRQLRLAVANQSPTTTAEIGDISILRDMTYDIFAPTVRERQALTSNPSGNDNVFDMAAFVLPISGTDPRNASL